MQFMRVCVSIILFGVIVSFIHFVVNVVNEMADGLGIRVFFVKDNKLIDKHDD